MSCNPEAGFSDKREVGRRFSPSRACCKCTQATPSDKVHSSALNADAAPVTSWGSLLFRVLDFYFDLSALIRCTVPVPSQSIFAVLRMPHDNYDASGSCASDIAFQSAVPKSTMCSSWQ